MAGDPSVRAAPRIHLTGTVTCSHCPEWSHKYRLDWDIEEDALSAVEYTQGEALQALSFHIRTVHTDTGETA